MEVYDSFLDLPLDTEYVEADGDDSAVPGAVGDLYEPFTEEFPLHILATGLGKQKLVVPFYPLNRKSRGKKVVALNRALSVAGYRKWQKFSYVWSPWVTKALKDFQKHHKLEASGVYNKETHDKLARYYDAYAIKHLLAKPKAGKEQRKRNDFLSELNYIYNRRWNIYYSQRRPFDVFKPPRGLDCSASGEWACRWAGIPSPSGYDSYGWGNTWSQMSRLASLNRRTTIEKAEVGDFIFYGIGGPTHVAYWIGNGRVWSFGSYPAKILNWDYRHDYLGVYDFMGVATWTN